MKDHSPILLLSFNPVSWKLIAISTAEYFSICSVDKCNELTFINTDRFAEFVINLLILQAFITTNIIINIKGIFIFLLKYQLLINFRYI